MKVDPLKVVEQAYDVDATTPAWLDRLSQTVNDQLGFGLGMQFFTYDFTPEGRMRLGASGVVGLPAAADNGARQLLESLPPSLVQSIFVRCVCMPQSELDPKEYDAIAPRQADFLAASGWKDILLLGGADPSRCGVAFCMGMPERREIHASTARSWRRHWARVAVHLTTAHRLRAHLSAAEKADPATAEAILTPGGRVEHVRDEAEPRGARERLVQAVKETERARGRLRAKEPEEALDLWKGLVSARWTLLDHFESDGRRYLLARRNELSVGGFASLTGRERQAMALASLGQTNKLIAYEMGISASTVGVLLFRAAKKLGAKSREELMAVGNGTGSVGHSVVRPNPSERTPDH